MSNTRRLRWGCGKKRSAGWIHADRAGVGGADINCDIVRDGLLVDPASIDCIVSQHALQQLDVYALWSALREMHRALKPGGVLRLGLIDLDTLIAAYQGRRMEHFWCRDWETLGGAFATQLVEHGQLRTPLNFEFAAELLHKAGFVDVRRLAYRQTATADPAITELDARPQESFYVEARRPLPSDALRDPDPVAMVERAAATQVHLSWTADPCTSFTVMWHGRERIEQPVMRYRRAGVTEWTSVPATVAPSPGEGFLYRADVTGLCADAEYEYCVAARAGDHGEGGDGGGGDVGSRGAVYVMRTLPLRGAADITFAFFCDTGLVGRPDGRANGTRQIIDEIIAAGPHFLLGGGDYAYADRDGRFAHDQVGHAVDAWFEQMQPALARFPLMAQFGNHEVFLTERWRDWSPRFAHPAGFDQGKNYGFDAGDAHIAALYAPGPDLSIDQLLWLDADLAEARRRGMRWLIVFQHEPVFAHGHSHPADPQTRRRLGPILERHRVDLHLSGHDQSYERTFPLLDVAGEVRIASTATHRYPAGAGVIYAKISPSGKRSDVRKDFSRFTTDQQPFVAVRDDAAHHYALITIRASGALDVSTIRVPGDGAPGTPLDTFSIVASGG